ncbi:hypothetical protein AB0B74_07160 [Micromonospora parva]|uniref:hypothetical protein n=2 Tax=Micromonospora parva TaxID=1464048 RepID=UPI00340B2F72
MADVLIGDPEQRDADPSGRANSPSGHAGHSLRMDDGNNWAELGFVVHKGRSGNRGWSAYATLEAWDDATTTDLSDVVTRLACDGRASIDGERSGVFADCPSWYGRAQSWGDDAGN